MLVISPTNFAVFIILLIFIFDYFLFLSRVVLTWAISVSLALRKRTRYQYHTSLEDFEADSIENYKNEVSGNDDFINNKKIEISFQK